MSPLSNNSNIKGIRLGPYTDALRTHMYKAPEESQEHVPLPLPVLSSEETEELNRLAEMLKDMCKDWKSHPMFDDRINIPVMQVRRVNCLFV